MKKTKLVKVLYVVDALLALLFIYMVISSIAYIVGYCESYGMAVSSMMGQAISYVITNSAAYLVYALLLFVGTRILDILTGTPKDDGSKKKVAYNYEDSECQCGCDCQCENEEESSDEEEPEEGKVPPIYTSASID